MNQSTFPVRRLARAALALAAAASFGLAAHSAFAQETQPAAPAQGGQIAIGIMDTQQVLNTSAAGKSLNAQWNAALKALNDDMDKKEGQLRTQAQQLEAARAGNPPMAPADYAAKRKALEQQDAQYQQDYGKKKQGLEQRLDKARGAITDAARKAMQDAAQKRGLTLIFDRSAVPYYPNPWNITEEVIQRLNKSLPNVKL